eukprot:TRINITY_DN3773_c0_g2_i1.p1 TRINITY_DN3773_c0_g2~~TRINITY_DN3773_c0_g2_i1.p1  ORF type:complete len:1031 (+),score=208.03 TRINITY_DN3773_c0_g2_i1:106-3198(+)
MKCCGRSNRRRSLTEEICVVVNDRVSNRQFHYPSNKIRTTKYTLLTFVPKNLFEQFRRVPNLYFLLMTILTLIPGVSPISPASSVLPFVLIVLVSALKEAYEDYRRWQSDNEYNNRRYEVYQGDQFSLMKNETIRVGDILRINENQEVPADLVLLNSSTDEGVCYVETSNLDGETNLKLFKAPKDTCKLKEEDLSSLKAIIRCEPPNAILYTFKGNMKINDGEDDKPEVVEHDDLDSTLIPLGDKQLLMRGTKIQNTKWAIGVVVYAGKRTKLALNHVSPPSKFSRTEKKINYASLVIFILQILLVTGCAVAYGVLELQSNDSKWYIPLTNSLIYESGVTFIAYFVLLGYFIPISLFVNLEVLKLVHAGFMMLDDDMKLDGKMMRVKNSNLNDELSKVSYVFSDKTGTLTQNKMIFDQCSVDGVKYKNAGTGGLKGSDSEAVHEFLLHMALNHEVLPEYEEGDDEPHYAAPTPDEIALVKGAAINGVQFIHRSNAGIKLKVGSKVISYAVLDSLEFSSKRKRSSVIVRTPEGDIVMFTKGADSVILERLSNKTKKSTLKTIQRHLDNYSKTGLRTLLLGKKELTEEEYKKFKQEYAAAEASISKREENKEEVMDKIERGLLLQGCTAIQDKLQDQVPQTIYYLIRAGIKVWMITGDKQETAENIGFSCMLLNSSSTIVRVVKARSSDHCLEMIQEARRIVKESSKVSLVIDGQSLVFALSEHEQLLLSVGRECETVIVCRADPLQKALVVRMIKRGTKKVCLSIGDGANDVSMLQEANIGVGLWGEEGTQAAQNSDYAIHQFSHLGKLVTVHGRYNMLRNSVMVEYSFYKNIAMFAVQFWFAIFSNFSAQTYYDDWVMTGFNTIILLLPPLSLAIFEKDLNESDIKRYPESYRELRKGMYLNKKTFIYSIIVAIYHSLVFFFAIYLLSDTKTMDGKSVDLWVVSTYTAFAAIITIIIRGAIITKHWVWVSHLFYWGSIALTFIVFAIESQWLSFFPKFYKVIDICVSLPSFWLFIAVVIGLSTVPDMAYQ